MKTSIVLWQKGKKSSDGYDRYGCGVDDFRRRCAYVRRNNAHGHEQLHVRRRQ